MKRRTRPRPKVAPVVEEVKREPTPEEKQKALYDLHHSIGFRGWACQEPLRNWGNYQGEHPKENK